MRTTLTLDDDVAVVLTRIRDATGMKLKEAVNHALRLGLAQMTTDRTCSSEREYTKPISAGECLIDLVSVSEALAVGEGENFR